MPGINALRGAVPCRRTRERWCTAHNRGLCECSLRAENSLYAGTGGVSQNNRGAGFIPAYLDAETGETRVSRFADGRPAPVHVLDGLPDTWIGERGADGSVLRTTSNIVAGFVRDGRFFSREAAAALITAASGETTPVHVD